MAVKGISVAYCTVGGVLLYSGIRGTSISDTAKGVLSGTLDVKPTQQISAPDSTGTSSDTTGTGSASGASSGSASANYLALGKYLMSNGYSRAAAAGIAGCVAGESSGNPESIGDQGTSYGLIQEHGSQYSSLVTGDASRDLDQQFSAIISYNNAQGSGLITMLNSISDPVAAADFYSEHFERPKDKDSDVVPSVAKSVYQELGKSLCLLR